MYGLWCRIDSQCRKRGVVYLLIVAVCSAVYYKCLFYGITNSDDEVMISNNLPFLRNVSNIFKVFTLDAFYQVRSIDLYRPLQSLSYIMDAQWGSNPVFNVHLTNLLLHIITCLVMFHLLELLDFRRRIALVGSLVYAAHYLFAAAVAWIPARGDLLLMLFILLALISFIRILENGSWGRYLLHLILFTLALFAKETAVILPILFGVYVWAFEKRECLTKRSLVLPVYYVAALLFYFTLKSASVLSPKGVTGFVPFLKNIRTFPETVAKFFIPINISTLPEYKLSATLSGLLIVAALVAVHIFVRKRLGKQVLFYTAWFVLFIAPGMAYFPNFYNFCYEHIDHRTYLVCFGLLMMVLNLVQIFGLDRARYFYAVALLLLGYLAVANLFLSASYRNPAEFAGRAIRTNPHSALAYSIYGTEMLMQGREDEAFDNLNRSIKICGQFLPALHYRARIFRTRGADREALADLDTLLATDPGYDATDYELRALIKIDLNDYAGAARDYESAIRLNPADVDAVKGLRELHRTVRDNRLLPGVQAAQRFNKEGIEAGKRGDFRQAENLFRQALSADPGYYGVNLNVGNALYEQGKVAEACSAWRVAGGYDISAATVLLKEYCSR